MRLLVLHLFLTSIYTTSERFLLSIYLIIYLSPCVDLADAYPGVVEDLKALVAAGKLLMIAHETKGVSVAHWRDWERGEVSIVPGCFFTLFLVPCLLKFRVLF